TLRAALVRGGRGGRQVSLTVEDRGPGIPALDRPHLFEPFYRGREVAAGGGVPGSGLGLSLVRRIVEVQRGTVTAGPRPGGGGRFPPPPPRGPRFGGAGEGAGWGGGGDGRGAGGLMKSAESAAGPRILLVEDEPSLVLTLTDRLVAEGYRVETVEDGNTALA